MHYFVVELNFNFLILWVNGLFAMIFGCFAIPAELGSAFASLAAAGPGDDDELYISFLDLTTARVVTPEEDEETEALWGDKNLLALPGHLFEDLAYGSPTNRSRNGEPGPYIISHPDRFGLSIPPCRRQERLSARSHGNG